MPWVASCWWMMHLSAGLQLHDSCHAFRTLLLEQRQSSVRNGHGEQDSLQA